MLPQNNNRAFPIRSIYVMLLFIFIHGHNVLAQKPSINSIDRSRSEVDAKITIHGNNFGTNINDLAVFFGGGKGEITSITNNQLEVKVPFATTYDYISVTNIATGLTGYAKEPFFLSFSGSGYNSWSAQSNFQDENGLIDLCMCDFNSNGKLDIATSSSGTNSISIWRNTSNLTTVNYEKSSINILSPTNNVTCGDIDGDGKPDLVYAKHGSNGDRIFVLRNISTSEVITFATPQPYLTTGFGTRRVKIKDLDNDGKPEIIVTNNAPSANPMYKIFIYHNKSILGDILFDTTPIELETEGLTSNGLDVEDLNGDGLPDIVYAPENDQNVFVFQNKSTIGEISFNARKKFIVSGSLAMVKIGDIDLDGKPDITVSKIIPPSQETRNLAILLNTSAAGNIDFAAEHLVQANPKAFGIDLGDLDGDGNLDIVVASVENSNTDVSKNNKITLLRNTSTPGNLSFNSLFLSTTGTSRMVKVADVNGDGKPDINFTTPSNSNLSVLRNQNCFTPRIIPPDFTVLCDGATITLEATKARGVAYTWTRNNIALTETSSSLSVSTDGSYKVQAVSEGGSCSRTSDAITITTASGSSPEAPVASNSGPVCTGGTLQLNATTISGADYKWTGPNNFSSAVQNPQIPDITEQAAGNYFLEVSFGNCPSEKVSTSVIVNTIEPQAITAQGPTSFCVGKNVILSVPTLTGYEYQWKFNGVSINGATSSTLQAEDSGNYTAILTKDNCSYETLPVKVAALPPPVASFTAPEMICLDKNFTLSNTSQSSTGVNTFYKWDFGDGTISTDKDAMHKYAAKGSYMIRLIVYYEDEDCKAEFTKSVSVVDEISVEILSDKPENTCEGETITLSVAGNYANYSWNTGAFSPTIQVTESGTYSVNVTTPEGCTGSGLIDIDFLLNPLVDIVAEDNLTSISRGESVQLSAFGANNYSWFPVDGLNDATISNPIAKPNATTTYTVIGTAANGCSVQKEITIQVSNTINVTPKKLFSPNGDNIDDFWVIDRIHNYPDCTVSIFDRQGLMVFEKTGYNNDWNGTYQGKNLMHGVYFFIIRCGSNENQKSGSITLIR